MSARHWKGSGPSYAIEWGGELWDLDLSRERPGLRVPERDIGPFLTLDGLSSRERDSREVFGPKSLIHHEIHQDRLEATYAFPHRGGITVRASWSPMGSLAIDLEIHLQADSVGELKCVEVELSSRSTSMMSLDDPTPRFDVAEPGFTWQDAAKDALYYEILRPHDVSFATTRDKDRAGGPLIKCYGLFGCDIEKGVVLRARARAFRIPGEVSHETLVRLREEFLAEPPPLGP